MIALLRNWWSLGVGSIAGAAVQVIQHELATGHTFAQMDYHQMGINALGGAILALFMHLAPPPPMTK